MKKILLVAVFVLLVCGAFMPYSAGNPTEEAPEVVVTVAPFDWTQDALESEAHEASGEVCVSLDENGSCDEWRKNYDEEGNELPEGEYWDCYADFGDACSTMWDSSWPESWKEFSGE